MILVLTPEAQAEFRRIDPLGEAKCRRDSVADLEGKGSLIPFPTRDEEGDRSG